MSELAYHLDPHGSSNLMFEGNAFIENRILQPYAKAFPLGVILDWNVVEKVCYARPLAPPPASGKPHAPGWVAIHVQPAAIPDFRWIKIPPRTPHIWTLRCKWASGGYQKALQVELHRAPFELLCADVALPREARMGFAVHLEEPPVPDAFIQELIEWTKGVWYARSC